MSDVTCARGVDLLMEYLEGTLPADLRASIDGHVSGCPRCVAFIASYRETPSILRTATVAELPPETKDLLRALVRSLPGEPRED